MAQSESVRAFKNELRNYHYYIGRAAELEDAIESLYDRLGGVRGVDPSKEPAHVLPNKEMEWKIREDITRLDLKLTNLRNKIAEIDEILGRIEEPIRTALKLVYIESNKVIMVAGMMYLSPSGLVKRMNREIKKALD